MILSISFQLPRNHFNLNMNFKISNNITGFIGPSGAGKTSLFNLISGVEDPKFGKLVLNDRILFDSEKKINIPQYKRNIGYVFQNHILFPHLSVRKNLEFGLKYSSKSIFSLKEIAELLQISHLLEKMPQEISGGEAQRVSLGRSILPYPSLLLLDEPLNSLDLNLKNKIISFLKSLNQFYKIPIMIISHERADIKKLTNQIFYIKNGEIKKTNKHNIIKDF